MLMIKRRAGESILIGDEIEVCVLDADADNVRLGVTAPRDVAVHIADPEADEGNDAIKDSAPSQDDDAID